MQAHVGARTCLMLWLLIEILLALAVLVGMVWWTMFAGRRGGERRDEDR